MNEKTEYTIINIFETNKAFSISMSMYILNIDKL